jgi:protein pelota
LIVSQLVPKQGICSLVVENPDDLWVLRRLIEPGDTVITKSSRVIKKEDEYSRPDRERVKVTVAVLVGEVSLDGSVDRLRIRGRITEASDDSVSTAGAHSVSISAGYGLTLKKKDWTPLHTHILNSARETGRRFLIVTVDRREAGVGLLSGSHLEIISSIDSGAGGKGAQEVDLGPFIQKIVGVLRNSWREGDVIVVAGPGHVKLKLANRIGADPDLKKNCVVVEGFDLAGSDGVRAMLRFEGFQQVARDSLLVEVQGVVDELIKRMAKGDGRVAYTLTRVKEAAEAGAVEKCVVLEDVFAHGVNEEDVVTTLNEIEERGGTVYLCDSSLEMGKQVSSFGGIVAILRYSLKRN